jgi:hypothetical protein
VQAEEDEEDGGGRKLQDRSWWGWLFLKPGSFGVVLVYLVYRAQLGGLSPSL